MSAVRIAGVHEGLERSALPGGRCYRRHWNGIQGRPRRLAFAGSGDKEAHKALAKRLTELSSMGDKLTQEVTLPLVAGIRSFCRWFLRWGYRVNGARCSVNLISIKW